MTLLQSQWQGLACTAIPLCEPIQRVPRQELCCLFHAGGLVLHNVSIKPGFVDSLDLPFACQAGKWCQHAVRISAISTMWPSR